MIILSTPIMGLPEPNPIWKCPTRTERVIMNEMIKVVAYEDEKRGVYKYSIIKDPKNETTELQRFIKERKIDLDIKVEVKEVALPEKKTVSTLTISPKKEHEIIAVLRGPNNGMVIFRSHPVIDHDLSSFLSWLINHENRYSLEHISEMTFYCKGLCETLEITPYAWGNDESIAFLAIDEK